MAANLTRLTHKIVIQLHPVAESCTICSSRSRRPVRKLLDTPSGRNNNAESEELFLKLLRRMYVQISSETGSRARHNRSSCVMFRLKDKCCATAYIAATGRPAFHLNWVLHATFLRSPNSVSFSSNLLVLLHYCIRFRSSVNTVNRLWAGWTAVRFPAGALDGSFSPDYPAQTASVSKLVDHMPPTYNELTSYPPLSTL
jgi:hypothetical protein